MSNSSLLETQKKPTATSAYKPVLAPQRRFDVPLGEHSAVSDQLSAAPEHDFGNVSLGHESTQACPLATPRTCPFGGACHTCSTRVRSKSEIGQSVDKHGQGADRVAERTTQVPEPQAQRMLCSSCLEIGEDKDRGKAGIGASDAGARDVARDGSAGPSGGVCKTIDVYPVVLPGATRNPHTDVDRANTIWSQCSVGVALSGGESWLTAVLDTLDPKGVLNEFSDPASPTEEELALLAHHPGGEDVIHAYFVPAMSAGSRGEAFIPSQTPSIRAIVVSNSAAVDTFAHELGHVLLDEGEHHSDPDNLMASGTIRNVGVDKLDATQCSKV